MSIRKDLVYALDVLTLGADAKLKRNREEASLESFEESRPWTMGKGVQGLGIGRKIADGELLSDLSLKVYVARKLPKSQCDNLVPAKLRMPGISSALATDVEEIGVVETELNTGRFRPAIPGCGVGHPKVTVGTFGCLVRKRGKKSPLFILSNSHVLADQGAAAVGDVILQPGKRDGGTKADDVLGELTDWVPFEFTSNGFPNLVDVAIAKVNKSRVSSKIPIIGVPVGVGNVVREGMMVQKTGRTTDYTRGVIKDVHYRLALKYKRPSGGSKGRVGLQQQVLCTRYTAGGDSGSAVCNMSGKVVGLHFAGSPSTSIFNRIGNVLEALDLEVVTEEF